MAASEDLLLEHEIAEWTRQNLRTLRYWRSQGVGPRWAKLGRRVVYRRADVQRWLDEQFETAS